jgi:hypothetical protein
MRYEILNTLLFTRRRSRSHFEGKPLLESGDIALPKCGAIAVQQQYE